MTATFSTSPRLATQATMQLLTETVTDIEPGHGGLIVVTGPHGSGKTELVDELVRSLPGWSAVRVAALSWRAEDEGNVVRALLDRAGSAEHTLLDAFDSPSSSVALVVDDAHWTDETSLQELVEATRYVREGRIAVIITALDNEDGVGQPSMTQLREMSDIDIGIPPYTLDDVRAFALAHAGAHLSPSVAADLRSLTGGLPGRIREVLDAAPNDIWGSQNVRIPIPRPWHAALQRRLNRVNEKQVYRILTAAAIMPDPGTALPDLLLTLTGDDRAALTAAFDAGIFESLTQAGQKVISFRHATDRAVIRSQTSPAEAARLHREAARYYHDNHDPDRALVHEALGSEGTDDDISDAVAKRADTLAQAGRWRSAADAYGLASQTANGPDRVLERHLSRVEALISASDIPQAQQHAGTIGHMTGDARLYSMRGYLALHEGRRSEAVGLIDLAWRTLDEQNNTDPNLRTLVASRQVLLALSEWQPERLVSWAATTEKWAIPDSPAAIEAQYISMIGKAATTGKLPEDQPFPGETPVLALRRDMAAGWLNLVHDDPIAARQRLSRSVDIDGAEGSERIRLWMDGWLARTHFVLGEFTEAQRVVERGLMRAERYGVRFLEPLLLWTGSQVASFRGERDLARSYANRLSLSHDSFMIQRIPSGMCRLLVSGIEGDQAGVMRAGRALTKLAETHDIGHPGYWVWEDVWAPQLIAAGEIDEADEITSRALERAEGSGIESMIARLGVPKASILIQKGDIDTGLKHFEESIEQIESLPVPAYQSRVLYEYGRVLRRLGRRRRADEAFVRAGEVFESMGAAEFVKRCNRERRAGGLGTRTSRAGGLTPQEEEIAKLVAGGATNREVATELFLSSKTVEYHLTRVYRKLGVRTRNELPGVLSEF
ncbi:helix-turn-helix transcriptional regulator [Corynebacterium yudongzhengii]|uniref:Helix-turn-helix transcriptional regulator n=1 Tax=Corynebacterium yudongzhengii TaxID=2080740 RepID=A0A2U1T8V8_9CORY|nr:LuxR family transcriptional regulator [Corynebacterium yudongzhengii]AWB82503.1 helix-turn-helix transcriptional regulator [Corynebacterium yudongzhengii]PWC02441.1 helix-turn-helix transcriptional regulator [Corynebacterium yudongzhengii]